MEHPCKMAVLVTIGALVLAGGIAGCQKRIAIDDRPPETIAVRYVPADGYSDCLVASAVMCGNYVLDSQRLAPRDVRSAIKAAGGDATRVGDMQRYLAGQGLRMVPLRGRFSAEPPLGLAWWVLGRGYPMICVINRHAGNAEYNHAVVVVGFRPADAARGEMRVYLLDPAAPKRLACWDRFLFEHYWGSAGWVMLPIFEEPRAPRSGGSAQTGGRP